MMLDITSAPTTSAWLLLPVDTIWLATPTENVKPEQAAARSKPQHLVAPILFWISAAVLGKNMSGVVVPTMIRSMSAGVSPACAMAFNAASLPRSDVATPLSTMCRVWMPVRWRIQSSVVSTIWLSFVLSRMPGGTYVASELMRVGRSMGPFTTVPNPSLGP
jgi:hypothetical protein